MNEVDEVQVATPTERELVLTRDFAAPRSLVWRTLTEPGLLKRWYVPTGWEMLVCDVDLKVGGTWRFVTRKADGGDVGQHGVYREIDAPARLVTTEEWEDWNPGEVLVTTTLTEHDGRTTYINTILFPTQEVRDMLISSGMTGGAGESYKKLDEVLESLSG